MATLQALLLADFAQVRGNLLYVVSGGIDLLRRPQLPAQTDFRLAGSLLLEPTEVGVAHELRLKLASEGQVILQAVIGVQYDLDGHEPPGYCPVLNFAVPIHVAVDHYGVYDVIAIVNDEEQRRVSFHVVEPPAD